MQLGVRSEQKYSKHNRTYHDGHHVRRQRPEAMTQVDDVVRDVAVPSDRSCDGERQGPSQDDEEIVPVEPAHRFPSYEQPDAQEDKRR